MFNPWVSPGEGNAYPLQHSGLDNSMDCPWSQRESDATERLSLSLSHLEFSSWTQFSRVCTGFIPAETSRVSKNSTQLNSDTIFPEIEADSLLAQTIKNLPAMQETQVRSLGQGDLLEKGVAITPVFLPGESHGKRSLVGYSPWGLKESDITEYHTISEADSTG